MTSQSARAVHLFNHLHKIDAGLIEGSECTAHKLRSFCDVTGEVVEIIQTYGREASNSCKMELERSTCDIDAVKHDVTKCSSCAMKHLHKIDAGLIKGSECTAHKLRSFCAGRFTGVSPECSHR
jgi:hypothetical protein